MIPETRLTQSFPGAWEVVQRVVAGLIAFNGSGYLSSYFSEGKGYSFGPGDSAARNGNIMARSIPRTYDPKLIYGFVYI